MQTDDPLTCQACVDRLDDYLDDELKTDLRRQVMVHLEGCASCKASLLEREKTIALVRQSLRMDTDIGTGDSASDMIASVLSALSAEKKDKKA